MNQPRQQLLQAPAYSSSYPISNQFQSNSQAYRFENDYLQPALSADLPEDNHDQTQAQQHILAEEEKDPANNHQTNQTHS